MTADPHRQPAPDIDPAAGRLSVYGCSRDELRALAERLGEPAYRGDQVFEWVWRRGARTWDDMTNLPARLRTRLAGEVSLALPRVVHEAASEDGTRKLLCGFEDGRAVECVLIPDGKRLTLCVSTQVGCALACRFCATGTMGFTRNLDAAEVAGQVMLSDQRARAAGFPPAGPGRPAVTHVVLMGMGEPLLNPRPVAKAVRILQDRRGLDLSPQRVTLSTVGIRTSLWSFLDETGVNLAISLHAPDRELRRQLMPVEDKHPIEATLAELRARRAQRPHQRVTFEYVLLGGVNDRPEQARALARKLHGIPCKVNLLPFNPHPGAPYERPADDVVDRFRATLVDNGLDAYVRRSRGSDIAAACGQLALDPGATPAPRISSPS